MNQLSIMFFAACSVFVVDATQKAKGAPNGHIDKVSINFTTNENWSYEGRIELPRKEVGNGFAVMMLGGGMGTPIDWAVPGDLTLDGKPTRDGETIATALLDAGFVVMRWNAIRVGDPQHAEDPLMMDAPPYPQTVEQAQKALAAFREKRVVPDSHIFLLGHSLGARRACILLEELPDCPGVVMLAGASLVSSDPDAARKILANFQKRSRRGSAGSAHDKHEQIAKGFADTIKTWESPDKTDKDRHGHRWPVDVIVGRKTPVLMLVGELDERMLLESYLFSAHLRRDRHTDYTWKVYENVGHQLGPEKAGEVVHEKYGVIAPGRVGPISDAVVRDIVDWLKRHAKSE